MLDLQPFVRLLSIPNAFVYQHDYFFLAAWQLAPGDPIGSGGPWTVHQKWKQKLREALGLGQADFMGQLLQNGLIQFFLGMKLQVFIDWAHP